ncbi:hexamethylene bis acetamide inducible 1 [Trichuris trichiura]|uniref:Hexamethylene bis acetamide inducible 1 n=1 Tax=Trichuris trichiura TaxID=36087 RepID=A0A077ZIL8_TRITR|nr:hexamethylene bis acetamide inducible 1 [Trichuris trichiura]
MDSESAGSDRTRRICNNRPTLPKRRRKRRRRAGRRHWKPYFKLSAEERRKLELREERRAERSRAIRFAHGIPVAPYNTTQFLLNDRQQRDEQQLQDVDAIVDTIRSRAVAESAEGHMLENGNDLLTTTDSPTTSDGDLNKMEKDFENEYELAHAERLESMSKAELINEYINMEKNVDYLHRLVSKLRQNIVILEQRCAAVPVERLSPARENAESDAPSISSMASGQPGG